MAAGSMGELSHRGPLTDRDRACEVLARESLNGVVLSHPVSVYHLTGYDSVGFNSFLPMQQSTCAVVMSADRAKPVALVIASRQYQWDFAHLHDSGEVIVYQYTEPPAADDVSSNDAVLATGREPLRAGEPFVYPNRNLEPLELLEARRAERVQREAKARPVTKSRRLALQRALQDLGLGRGRIGVDVALGSPDWRAIEDIIPRANLEDAGKAAALMRVVKSQAEIAIMKRAARNNAEAALAACQAVRAGGNYRDLRAAFYTEAARRGNLGIWMIVDRVIHDAWDPGFRNGQAFMIDAVSSFQGYHGDYGRTVFVGEPSRHMLKGTRAIDLAWSAMRERLRPGVSFREIQAIGQNALEKSGNDTAVRITPHSVGIVHTDARAVGDIVLEPGMVISVDCPVTEIGIGGSAHLEDLTLITADGHEVLNDIGNQVIVV